MRKRVGRALGWFGSLWLVPLFVIRVRDGTPAARRGVVTSKFLAACGDVLRDHGVSRCTIRGFKNGDRISLRFSPGVPDAARQGVRNVWAVHR